MTNPNDGVGTNVGFNGRTTPKALNDILQGWSAAGIVSGWACSPKSGMTIQIGGNGTVRDAAIAENNAGDRTTINNRLASPVEITLNAAPATGNRYDSIVAYVDGSQIGTGASDVDFPSITGIIAVSGTAASSPTKPTSTQIRTAITADGADGTTAYYVVLADILVGQGVTTIGSGVISQGTKAAPANITLGTNAVVTSNIQNKAVTAAKTNGSTFSRMTVRLASDLTNAVVNAVISLNTLGGSTGTQLTQSGGGIRIGSGVSMVRVSASVFFNNVANKNYGWYELRKNGTAIGYESIASIYGNSFCAGTLAPIILPVAEGDVITIYNKEGGTSIRANSTYLTVEAIA